MTDSPLRLRIVHYLPTISLADGGVARAVLDWCSVLASRGHDVQLLCNNPVDVPAPWKESHPGLPHLVHLSEPQSVLRTSVIARRIIQQADILHLHAPWLAGNIGLARVARRSGVPYVITVHGMLDEWSMAQRRGKKRVYLALFGRRLLNQAAAVHCTAEAELTQARQWFSNPSTEVLPCLMDLTPFENLPGPELAVQRLPAAVRCEPKLLYLGRLHEKKGVDLLIRAAALMRDDGTRFVLLIAGSGDSAYEKSLVSLVKGLNLNQHVLFLGLVTGMDKISLYQAADIFALPTQQENFGLALVEAMAAGAPVLTTTGTDIWKEIQSAGAVIVDRTPQAFATAAVNLLGDPVDRARRSTQGRNWVLSRMATKPLSESYEKMYCKLAGKG